MLGVTLKRLGIHVTFVNPDDLEAWENAVTDKTRMFFVETVGNPNANVANLEQIGKIAHKHSIPYVVDSTFTTPALCRPIEFGADIVIHSATKFLGGHSNVMGGLVAVSYTHLDVYKRQHQTLAVPNQNPLYHLLSRYYL